MRALERKSGKINGENMAKMKKSVTMSDIAERLEVSTVTVSKALSGQKGVSEEIASIAGAVAIVPINGIGGKCSSGFFLQMYSPSL